MTNLVSFNLENGNVLTSSLIIADQVDNQHKSVIQLIRQNLVDLEEFGRVAFEMSPFETDGGTQNNQMKLSPKITIKECGNKRLRYVRSNPIDKDLRKKK